MSIYRKPKVRAAEWEEWVKSRLDFWHTQMPYLGVRRLREQLRKEGLSNRQEAHPAIHAGNGDLCGISEAEPLEAQSEAQNFSLSAAQSED